MQPEAESARYAAMITIPDTAIAIAASLFSQAAKTNEEASADLLMFHGLPPETPEG